MNREQLKGFFLLTLLVAVVGVFFFVPSLRPSTLLSILNVLLLSPIIQMLEKKGLGKNTSIFVVFLIMGFLVFGGITYATQVLASQWETILDQLPVLGSQVVDRLNGIENQISETLNIKINLGLTQWFSKIGSQTQEWLIIHLPELFGDAASALFLVPIFSYFFIRDQESIRYELTQLMPSKFRRANATAFEKISKSLSRFLRAKTIEALLVGLMTFIGLTITQTPYAGVFAIIAGVTNLIPYLGPIIGMAPALALVGFSDLGSFWTTFFVYLVVNAIDMLVIFPVFVSRLVNLSPMILLVSVAVGQEFYGVVGMLIAVPLASILKIILIEVRELVYGV